jgi:hypothetical protein
MVHDRAGERVMGAWSTFPGRVSGLAAVGILALTAVAVADPPADSRLMFDPGALDRSQLGSGRNLPRPPSKPVDPAPVQTIDPIWTPNAIDLPDFGTRARVSRGLAQGLSSPNNQLAPAQVNLFEQRVTPGTVSIGLETETMIKQRSLSGDGEKDPERDTILDPKRQRGFLPFIGLSAKSSLQ